MSLDLAPLENALAELGTFLNLCEEQQTSSGPLSAQQRAIQAGTIQAFEFTYELCHKMLRRYLELTMPSPSEIRELSFPDLIRTGYRQHIVRSEWKIWSAIRDMRNITIHTYDPKKAATVLRAIPGFMEEALHLLAAMQSQPPE